MPFDLHILEMFAKSERLHRFRLEFGMERFFTRSQSSTLDASLSWYLVLYIP